MFTACTKKKYSDKHSCNNNIKQLHEFFEKDEITNDIADQYIQSLKVGCMSSCCPHYKDHKQNMVFIGQNYMPSEASVIHALKISPTNFCHLMNELIERDYTFTPDILTTTLKSSKNVKYALKIVDKVKADTSHLLQVSFYTTDQSELAEKIIAQGVKPTDVMLANAIGKSHGDVFLKHGAKYNTASLEKVCTFREKSNGYNKLILNILKTGVKPTQQCFQNYTSRNRYRRKCKAFNADNAANMIEKFIEYGYTPTYDDLLYALKNGYYIKNVTRFNYSFTREVYQLCHPMGWYPYGEKDTGLAFGIDELQDMCDTPNVDPSCIKKFIKEHHIKPTIECLQNVCKYNNASLIHMFIVEYGLKPDKVCITNRMLGKGVTASKCLLNNIDWNHFSDKNAKPDDTTTIVQPKVNTSQKIIIKESKPTPKIWLAHEKRLIKDNIRSVLNLDEQLSFNDLRAHIMQYVQINDLCDGMTITIDHTLAQVTGLNEKDVVQPEKIDSMLKLCFK